MNFDDIKSLIAKFRIQILLALALITPLGFYTKFYEGPLENWVNNSLGGLLYEVFWCLVVASLFPKWRPLKIAAGVFLITGLLEIFQLSDAGILAFARSFFIGKVILGTTFVWSDFFYYAVGSLMGWSVLRLLKKWSAAKEHSY